MGRYHSSYDRDIFIEISSQLTIAMQHFFLLLFSSLFFGCSSQSLNGECDRSKPYYHGISHSPDIFVANYIDFEDKKTGYFLPAPIIFKMSTRRDSLFILSSGQYQVAKQNDCSHGYILKYKSFFIFYTIDAKFRCIHAKIGSKKFSLKNKSMI